MSSPSLRQLDIFAQMVAAGSAARCAQDLGLDPVSYTHLTLPTIYSV